MSVRLFYLFTALVLSAAMPLSAAQRVSDFLKKSDEWFISSEGRAIAQNIIGQQTAAGDWPKNVDTTSGTARAVAETGTFDNGATIPELQFLARSFNLTKDPRSEAAVLRGLEHILDAQYANGGWPQKHPPGKGYARHITFNDSTMVNLLNFVRDVAESDTFKFVPTKQRARAADSFQRGIACILKCQITVNGQLTAWCAQHDEMDFSPRPARSFEPVSLSGAESAGVVKLLMSLEKPSEAVIKSVEAAVIWFDAVKLQGIREVRVRDDKSPTGWDKRILQDPAAQPLWARFYDISSMKPIFMDRDGVPRQNVSEISYERRNGYAWHVTSPQSVLKAYPSWKNKISRKP